MTAVAPSLTCALHSSSPLSRSMREFLGRAGVTMIALMLFSLFLMRVVK